MSNSIPQVKESNKIRDVFCSDPMVGIGGAVSIALAVLGTLTIVGMLLPPTNPLGVLAGVFGPAGGVVTLLFGLTLFVTVLIGRFSCFKKPVSEESTKQHPETPRPGIPSDTITQSDNQTQNLDADRTYEQFVQSFEQKFLASLPLEQRRRRSIISVLPEIDE